VVATYKDIRRLTGLSLATISKYYNGGNVLGPNRELIEKAAAGLDYQVNNVARGLRSRRSMTIGVVLDQLNSTFNTTIVSRVEERLREAGYGTIICDARQDPHSQAEVVRFLIGKMVDGIVVVPVGDDTSFLKPARHRDVPVVAIDRLMPGTDSVVIDNRAAIASAVQLLTDSGHTTIGLLAGPDTTYTMRERRAGFRDAVRARTGLLPRVELLTPEEVSIEGGYAGLRRLIHLSAPPTAVVCANYGLTLGASIAQNELGSDLRPALVGFDNLELARLIRPRPTLVTQPIDKLALEAAELLLQRLNGEGPDEPVTIILNTTLMVGHESTYQLIPRVRTQR
jgi:LacI family transcriptional regulator